MSSYNVHPAQTTLSRPCHYEYNFLSSRCVGGNSCSIVVRQHGLDKDGRKIVPYCSDYVPKLKCLGLGEAHGDRNYTFCAGGRQDGRGTEKSRMFSLTELCTLVLWTR